MKNTNKNTNINVNAQAAAAQEEPKLSPYATNAMRPAIIQKSIDGVRRAITPKMCEDCGVSEISLVEWKYNVSRLYEAAVEYSRAIGTDSEQEREQEVWDTWRTIIRVGEEDRFHPNMFVRRKDVENLRVLAAESDEMYVKGIGFIPTVKGQEAFRSKVEIRLALRIAGNKTLNDRQREVLKDYQKAERVIKQADMILQGYTQGKTTVPAISAQITEAEQELATLQDILKKAGADADKLTKRQQGVVKTLKEQQKAAEERKKKYAKILKDNAESYEQIIDSLDAIEGAADKADVPAGKVDRDQLVKEIEEKLGK